jgi:hypothetical protein
VDPAERHSGVTYLGTALNAAVANLKGAGKLSAIAIPLPGTGPPDAPISRSDMSGVIGGVQSVINEVQRKIQTEIQNVANDVCTVRTAVTTAVTDERVEATTRAMLAEYEHREAAVTLRDLQWALAGIAIQAAGAMITGLGLIVGM